jgi:hypothetical protein
MALSKIRTLAEQAKTSSENNMMMLSAQSFLFYGTESSKSTLAVSQLTTDPILVLSPANGSAHLKSEYPHCVFYTVDSLEDLESMIKDLENNMNLIRKLMNLSKDGIKEYREKVFPKLFGQQKPSKEEIEEEWEAIMHYVNEKKFPFHSVVLEEIEIVSSWIADKVEKMFDVEVIGQDKKNMASDWSALKQEVINLYSRFLKLPVRTIFACSDKKPNESQNGTQTVPNICQGAAARLLISMIGNVLYSYKDKDKYYVRLLPNGAFLIRTKLSTIKNPIVLPEILDITNAPEKFWQLVDNCEEVRGIAKK